MVALNDGQNYDITVTSDEHGPRIYRTLQLLSSPLVSDFQSRGTRVWKAVLLEGGEPSGAPVALKDVWADPSMPSEGAIYRDIHASSVKTDLDTPSEYLLTPLAHGDVVLNDALDCTPLFPPSSASSDACKPRTRNEIPDLLDTEPTRKVHYRMVFAQVCRPIHQETSPGVIFQTLAQAAYGVLLDLIHNSWADRHTEQALRAMHRVGWLHRDMKTRSILIERDGTVRLAGLKYAARYGEGNGYRIVRLTSVSYISQLDSQPLLSARRDRMILCRWKSTARCTVSILI